MTSKDSDNIISSQELQDGLTLWNWQDGPQTDPALQDRAHVSHSRRRAREKENRMSGTCGRNSSDSSGSVDRPSSSESKSLPAPVASGSVAMRDCPGCATSKPSCEFYKNSKGQYRKQCKECWKARERKRKGTIPGEQRSKHFKRWRRENRAKALIAQAKYRAKVKGLEFNLDFYVDDIQGVFDAGVCELTGVPFNFEGGKTWDSPSLDRIDSKKGYTFSNVRVVLYCVNVMANIWGENKIIEIADAIMDRRRDRSATLQRNLDSALKRLIDTQSSPECELTWSHVAMSSGAPIYRLRAVGRRTSANDCSGAPSAAHPTPKETDATSNVERPDARYLRDGRATYSNLPSAADGAIPPAVHPTPCVAETDGSPRPSRAATGRTTEYLGRTSQLAIHPTPDAQAFGVSDSRFLERREEIRAQGINGNGFGLTLGMVAAMACHPTPDSSHHGMLNPEAALKRVQQHRHGGEKRSANLDDVASLAMHATPRASDDAGEATPTETTRRRTAAGQATLSQMSQEVIGTPSTSSTTGTESSAAARGFLNPWLSLWLMGYPLTWLKCGLISAAGSRSRRRKSKGGT